MAENLQALSPEQNRALISLSKMAFDAEVKRRAELVAKTPALAKLLDQKPHPQSKCGCGCDWQVCGCFCIDSCGCGTVYINSSQLSVGIVNQQQLNASFSGVVYGNVYSSFSIPGVNMSGELYNIENLTNGPLQVQLDTGYNHVQLSFSDDYGRYLGAISGYTSYQLVPFSGRGTGSFSIV